MYFSLPTFSKLAVLRGIRSLFIACLAPCTDMVQYGRLYNWLAEHTTFNRVSTLYAVPAYTVQYNACRQDCTRTTHSYKGKLASNTTPLLAKDDAHDIIEE